jgi:uncharacterized protein YlzI (FlbEa/FlbD family)
MFKNQKVLKYKYVIYILEIKNQKRVSWMETFGSLEKFENLEKFDDGEKAHRRAKELQGVLIKYSIKRTPNGKFDARVRVLEAFDDLTNDVFTLTETGKRARSVVCENENVYYEDAEETDNSIQFICKNFTEAKEKVAEVIEKIIENRKKVRQTEQREEAYVVF